MKQEEAKKVYDQAFEIINDQNLLFNNEDKRLQFDTWVQGGEESYTMSVIDEKPNLVISSSQAWSEKECGVMFKIETSNVNDLLGNMIFAAAIKDVKL